MECFDKNGIVINYDYSVSYDTEQKSFDKCGGHIQVVRETEKINDSLISTRLRITNVSQQDILLKSAYPIVSESLQIGNVISSQWVIMNQGRHKNDLPAVFTAGKRDKAFADSFNRMSEKGSLVECRAEGRVEMFGDQITAIRGGDKTLCMTFETSDRQSTEFVYTIENDGAVSKILAGGEFNCILRSGETTYSEWVGIDVRDDALAAIDDFAKRKAKRYNARVVHKKPSVFCTWYYYGTDVTSHDVFTNLDVIYQKKLPFTCVQVDMGWEDYYGDWNPNSQFPCGMREIAEKIRGKGIDAGLWTCPFIADAHSELFREHPEYFLKHNDGSLALFPMTGINYPVLDLANPAVLELIENWYREFASWGYNYHKLDFTRAFPILRNIDCYDKHKTVTEAYVDAMKAIRRGVGEDAYILLCGGLFDPVIGLVDGQRSGSDVKSMWIDSDGKNPKIPFTVKQNVLRYFMNDWWHNDPDALMVRRNKIICNSFPDLCLGLLNDEEAKTFTANQYFSGGLVCSTEPLDLIENDRLYLLRHICPVTDTKVWLNAMFNGKRFVDTVDVVVKNSWHTVCFTNWEDCEKPLEFTLNRDLCRGLDSDKVYMVSSFYGGQILKNVRYGERINLGMLSAHGTEIVKVCAMDKLQVAASNMHYSFGGEVDELRFENGVLTFRVDFGYDYPAHYKIYIPELDEFVEAEGTRKIDIKMKL